MPVAIGGEVRENARPGPRQLPAVDLEEAEMRAQWDMRERGRRLCSYAAIVGITNVWWRHQERTISENFV